jgi:hypothetical protein
MGAPLAGVMHRLRHQFLAAAGFTLQQHAGARRRHPRHQFEHALEGGRPADETAALGHAARHLERLHLFDEPCDLAGAVAHRRQFDIHVFLAARCLVQVDDALALFRFQTARQRTGLAGTVARHAVVVRYVVTGAADHAAPATVLCAVGLVGGDHPVVAVEQDVRFGCQFDEGHQFGQRTHVV